jgi:hypothetical protein
MEKAAGEVARLEAAISERQPKQQRTGAREPRPYDGYRVEEWQRQESWVWTRRRTELVADAPSRLPEAMPRGEKDGPMYHWRRGLVYAVQDWAEGSKADAAKLVLSLIKELELEVRPLPGLGRPIPSHPIPSHPIPSHPIPSHPIPALPSPSCYGRYAVLTALHLSRATLRRIHHNFIWAFAYNLVGIPFAAGVLYPSARLHLPPMFAGAPPHTRAALSTRT